MKSLHVLAAASVLMALGVAAPHAPVPDKGGRLLGVAVDSLWQACNFVRVEFLTGPPNFVQKGTDYVGTTSLNAVSPSTGEPLGVEITWTISVLDQNSRVRTDFAAPSDAQYLVVAHFDYGRGNAAVDALSVVSVRGGNLVPQNLGYVKADGTTVTGTADLAASVFSALNIRGPITNQIVVQP